MTIAPDRPDLETIADAATFRDWYWLKAELMDYCRAHGLATTGKKADLADRIAHYLETGDRVAPASRKRARPSSSFDWAHAELTRETVITDSYTNGPNTRAFFEREIGPRFRFSIAFMDWMRTNTGKTLGDAVEAWLALEQRRKKGERSVIPEGNQYNRYVRDFFDANPGRTMAEARASWLAKRNRPGTNRYEPGDLETLDKRQRRNDRQPAALVTRNGRSR